jgi:cobalt-zinc-cadmium efflux system membrane fusion protein
MNGRRAVALVLASALLGACHHAATEAEAPEPHVDGARVSFASDSPELGSLQVGAPRETQTPTITVNGRLAWDENATVRVYSPFGGRITQIVADPGQVVAKGDVLARLASSDFGQAEADARKAASDLRLAERTLAREHDLYEHGAAARRDLEAAEADQARASAESQWTSARLAAYGEAARSADGSFALRAPLAGTVVERNLAPGQDVRPDQMMAGSEKLAAPLFTITDPTRLWVFMDVSEHDAEKLAVGDPFTVRLHLDPSRTLQGRVELVSPSLDPVTRTVKVRGSLANADGALRAEMLVNVDVATEDDRKVAEVPVAAVLLRGDKHFVFVEDEPGSFERREVAIGHEQEGWLSVTSGLDGDHRVVTQGALLLEKIYQDAAGS